MNSLVYIIIINYNGYEDTIECVKSIKKNIKEDYYKIIIVDNKSTNDSVQILKKELKKDVKLIESSINGGFSYGNNLGIKYAKKCGAKYVLLLNNDTIIANDFLMPIIDFANKHKDCGCITPRINYYYDKNIIWYDGGDFNHYTCRADHININKKEGKTNGIKETNFISGCCMLIPLEVIRKIGLMDERYFLYVEDTEYSLRIKTNGYKLYYDSTHKIYHKVNASTKKISENTQFYEIRNRLLLKDTYLNNIQKMTTCIYNIIFYTYKVFTKKYSINIIKEAQKANKDKKYGERIRKGEKYDK